MIRCSISRRRRSAYTLLEVLLASAIGVLLMAALYVAVDVQLRHARAGREVVQQSTLVRALITRITTDVASNIGPEAPQAANSPAAAAGAPGGGGGGAGGGTSSPSAPSMASGPSSPSSPSSGASSSSSSSSNGSSATSAVQFNLGVQGDSGRLSLFVSKVPRELQWNADATTNAQSISDLRRITYWLVGGGDSPLGLARQEIKPVTSSDAISQMPPDIPDENTYIIAEEVKSLSFSYFDGTNWQDTWDGTTAGADGVTPQGPPILIAIIIGVPAPGGDGGNANEIRTYRHVISIASANGAAVQSTTGTTGTTSN